MDASIKQAKNYFIIAYLWTWVFWGIAVIIQKPIDTFPTPILIALGGVGPVLSALFLLISSKDKKAMHDYWERALSLKRPGAKWISIALLLFPLIVLTSFLITKVFDKSITLGIEARFASNLWSLVPFFFFTFAFGPIPEELGWRGFALDKLLKKQSPLKASLILGFLWTLWHLPLFFIKGSYQNMLTPGSLSFLWYLVDKVLQTIMMTWIYIKSDRSILTAILFHFSVNFVGEVFFMDERVLIVEFLLSTIAAGMIALQWQKEPSMQVNRANKKGK